MTDLRALVIDYGGVLTSPLQDSLQSWCEDDEIDLAVFQRVLGEWLGPAYGQESVTNPIHALERGDLALPDFERELARRLHTHDGRPVEADGLLARMVSGFRREQPMFDAVSRVRAHGFKTALLSNSWGPGYSRDGWDELFDTAVISSEVGMRKPEPGIYRLAADRLGLPTHACVFVDDAGTNVKGAVAVGMVGVKFVSAEQALEELEALFGVDLRH